MGMENDLDAEEERGRGVIKRGTKGEKRTAQGHRAGDLQTAYYANNATITSQFSADCLSCFLVVVCVCTVI